MPACPRSMFRLATGLLMGFFLLISTPAQAERILLFAASSTADAVTAVIRAYEKQHPEDRVILSLGSSSTLARQIMQGARADLFLSANRAWMTELENAGKISTDYRVKLFSNRLVWAAAQKIPHADLVAEASKRRLIIGDPAHVPVGIYARQSLQHAGVWEQLQARLIYAKSARDAALLAQRSQAPAIIYRTDLLASGSKLHLLQTIPEDHHAGIEYPFAVAAGRARPSVARFFRFALSRQAREIYDRLGFSALAEQ